MTAPEPHDDTDRSPVAESLHGAAFVRLEFHSESLAEPFRERFDADVTIAVDSIVQLPDGTHLQYWTIADGAAKSLLETFDEFPTVLDARLLATDGDRHRFEVHGREASLFASFFAFDGVTRSARYDANDIHIVADFPTDVDVSAVVDAVNDLVPDIDLVSSTEVRTASVVRGALSAALTDRQWTALQLAYFGGYFERPRESTGVELADRMGISRQAFHEHLRKAYRTVFEYLLETDHERAG